MSLSSQYLEELSRRYKKQVEELQQSFAKTILSFEGHKQAMEEKQSLEEENSRLRKDIADVLESFVVWKSILFYMLVFVGIQIVLFVLLLLLYVKSRIKDKRREKRREEEAKQLQSVESRRMSVAVDADAKGGCRRNSTEGISGSSRSTTSLLSEGKKRPSEEALQIVGTYSELLIESPKESVSLSSSGGGQRKKKDKLRSRKTSLPNQVFLSEDHQQQQQQRKTTKLLQHSNSVNGTCAGGGSIGNEEGAAAAVVDTDEVGSVVLEENDEFYLPGSDLSYVEYVPEEGEQPGGVRKDKGNSRRLSSPAFLKTALSRSIRSSQKKKSYINSSRRGEEGNRSASDLAKVGNVSTSGGGVDEEDVQSTTSNSSWDWYKLRRSSGKSTSSTLLTRNGSVSLSSHDSVQAVDQIEGEEEERDVEQVMDVTPKKTTKFRKILKKVF